MQKEYEILRILNIIKCVLSLFMCDCRTKCIITGTPLTQIADHFRKNFRMHQDMQVLMTEKEIDVLHQKLADKLNAHYESLCTVDKPLQILGILNGCYRFVSDLTKLLHFEFEVNFFKVSSYANQKQTGSMVFDEEFVRKFADKEQVLLMDDIWDSGSTFLAVEKIVPHAKICAFVVKGKEDNPKVDFAGIQKCPQVWVIGSGFHFGIVGRGWPIVVYRAEKPEEEEEDFREKILCPYIKQ